MSRSIIVDDNDSGIIYSGSWFKDDSGAFDTMGNFGPPMLGTLHGTNSTASFKYTFSGTKFTVTNSNQFNSPTGLNITCLIDNESVPVIISTLPLNNVLLCTKDGLADTEHTFVLNAVVTNQEAFWFDYLSYVPSASVSLDKAPLSIGNDDAQLQSGIGAGWKTFSPGFQTTQPGAQFTFPFTGVSLTWYGFYDPSLSWDTSLKTATYSIDGGAPISFNTLTDVANRTDKPTGVRYNQVLFQTDDLPNTNHNLLVTYQGTNTSTPLTLEFLVVNPNTRDGAVTAASAAPSSSTPSSNSGATSLVPTSASSLPGKSGNSSPTNALPPSASGSPGKSTNLGVIVGAVIGGIVILALLMILFFFLRRRQKNGYQRPTDILAPAMAERVLPIEPMPNRNPSYASHPSPSGANRTITTSNSVPASIHTNTSYVAPSHASDPFSDAEHESDNSYYPQASTSAQPYGASVVELTPHGRIIHSSDPSPGPSTSGKGRIPMHVATTVVQDEDSGVRLPQTSDQGHVEILPPSYSKD